MGTVQFTCDDPGMTMQFSPSSSVFAINPTTGVVTCIVSFDAERLSTSYTLNVDMFDSSASQVDAMTLTIQPVDINDNTPIFSAASYAVSTAENTVIPTGGLRLTSFTVTDADLTFRNSRVTCTITAGNPSNLFNITTAYAGSTATCTLWLLRMLDYEVQQLYILDVAAPDQGTPVLTGRAKVNVTVTNVNDNAPVFNTTFFNVTIPENVAAGTRVVNVSAYDPDNLSALTFTVSDITDLTHPSYKFDISSTGVITVSNRGPIIDRDGNNPALYALVVFASDGLFTSNISVIVNIQDLNDNAPVWGAACDGSVYENTATAAFIAQCLATDADLPNTPNSLVSYVQISASPYVTLNTTSGEITVSGPIDYEQVQSFTLVIQARDAGTPMQVSPNRTVTITVLDVNDNWPRFTANNYSVAIQETQSPSTTVIVVSAVDADLSAPFRTLTYSLTSNPAFPFSIVSTTGAIIVATNLDYETTTSYVLTVQARDQGNPPNINSTDVYISIIDVNEFSPVFNISGSFSCSYPENQAPVVCTTLQATDADGSGNVVTYSLQNTLGGMFSIDATTGVLSAVLPADRETRDFYLLTVLASDSAPLPRVTTQVVSVAITDVNDNSPQYDQLAYNITIYENITALSEVVRVRATDRDLGVNGFVIYSISNANGYESTFTIQTINGIGVLSVAFPSQVDYERVRSYRISIMAQDQATVNPLSNFTDVFITVLDVNDNRPVFDQSSYSPRIALNSPSGTLITLIRATDADSGLNGQLFYDLIGSTEVLSRFALNATGVLYTIFNFNGNATTAYDMVVRATDRGTPPLSTNVNVQVQLVEPGLLNPAFDLPVYIVVHTETDFSRNITAQDMYFLVVTVRAREAGTSVNPLMTYSIIGGNVGGIFTIQTQIASDGYPVGVIYVNSTFDRENISEYVLTIQASNGALLGPVRYGNGTVRLIIDDINDNAPIFTQPLYRFNVSEAAATGTVVATVRATDADVGNNGLVSYYIASDPDNRFRIDDPYSGQIKLANPLDFETKRFHIIIVNATDQGPVPFTASTVVNISVTDVNDNAPVFSAITTCYVSEGLPAPQPCMYVNVTDRVSFFFCVCDLCLKTLCKRFVCVGVFKFCLFFKLLSWTNVINVVD